MCATDPASYEEHIREQTNLQNKDSVEAEAAEMAMELRQIFTTDGRMSSVSFFPTCSVKFDQGRRYVLPACNLRRDCETHRPLLDVPDSLLAAVRTEMLSASDQLAFGYTVRLVREIARATGPAEMWDAIRSWVPDGVPGGTISAWAAYCIRERWLPEVTKGAAVPRALGFVAATDPLRQGAFIPAIAGCDAFEWGLLAAMSRIPGATSVVVGAICQQTAEFVCGTLSPVGRRRAIDAIRKLVGVPGLFSNETVEQSEHFIRRLGAESHLLEMATTDLYTYFEQILASVSYPVASYLRVEPFRVSNEERRQWYATKKRSTQQSATQDLASMCNILLSTNLVGKEARLSLVESLVLENKNALEEEFQIVARVANQGDNERMKGWRLLRQQEEAQALALAVTPRIVSASLLLLRGGLSVTPCALNLMGREPSLDHLPLSMHEAIREPNVRTLEAFHAARFGVASQTVAEYLCRVRRTAEPTWLQPQVKTKIGAST